jgi:hypothetical protein
MSLRKRKFRILTSIESIEGMGLGSFINSNYGSTSPINVGFRYSKGVMFVVALIQSPL